MNIADIKWNDTANSQGVAVSVYVSGCRRRCKGCHNAHAWDFDYGYTFTDDVLNKIKENIIAHGIKRKLCVLGGEPLEKENAPSVLYLIKECKKAFPWLEVYLWTGFTRGKDLDETDPTIKEILKNVNTLIDGPYIEEERDITLMMRGSKNQKIINLNT